MANNQVNSEARLQRRMRPLLGTFIEIAVVKSEQSDAVLAAAFRAIEEVQRLLSFHDPLSDLSRLNGASGQAVRLQPLSLRVLRLARAMTHSSGGLFNCTVGGALVAQGALPDHGGDAPLAWGRAEDIELNGGYARLRRPVRITLDGIAKGYAVDRAVEVMLLAGASGGWVNAGGDLRSFGGVALPVQRREVDGSYTLLGAIQDEALASSAIYPQQDSSFPSHIVHNGKAPLHDGVWSVAARRAWRADALTKVAALAPAEPRAAIVQQLGGRLI